MGAVGTQLLNAVAGFAAKQFGAFAGCIEGGKKLVRGATCSKSHIKWDVCQLQTATRQWPAL
jgi:hypothetical protein